MKVYVSLALIKQNETLVVETLESISSQTLAPDKCFIWASEEPYLLDTGFQNRKIGAPLSNFLRENPLFEIRWCPNTGPFRKLLPLLEEKFDEDCLILTIDDDTVYIDTIVEKFADDFQTYGCCIGYWGLTLWHEGDIRELHYEYFAETIPDYLFNFHLGKGGVAYHPSFFRKTREIIFDEALIKATCPTNDDIWFNFLRIANGVLCHADNIGFMTKDNTNEKTALWSNFNGWNKANTTSMRAVIELLARKGYLQIEK